MKSVLKFSVLAVLLLGAIPLFAHTVNYDMELKPTHNVISYYIGLGFEHILPYGIDHILFVLCLFLLEPKLKSVILQASCFTVAHTITLILSMRDLITPAANIVEPIIAISIVFVALENIFIGQLKPSRYIIVFAFGLIHGMGFASALNEIGLPRNAFFTSLISFNVGVEFGQVAVILIAYLLIGLPFSKKIWYRQRLVYPISIAIALIAGYWTIERIFGTTL